MAKGDMRAAVQQGMGQGGRSQLNAATGSVPGQTSGANGTNNTIGNAIAPSGDMFQRLMQMLQSPQFQQLINQRAGGISPATNNQSGIGNQNPLGNMGGGFGLPPLPPAANADTTKAPWTNLIGQTPGTDFGMNRNTGITGGAFKSYQPMSSIPGLMPSAPLMGNMMNNPRYNSSMGFNNGGSFRSNQGL